MQCKCPIPSRYEFWTTVLTTPVEQAKAAWLADRERVIRDGEYLAGRIVKPTSY